MTPLEKYHLFLSEGTVTPDISQKSAIEKLNDLYFNTISSGEEKPSALKKLFKKKHYHRGIYMWGGTGRGKTFLMDTFYSCIEFSEKNRLHFHRFMREIHSQIRQLEHHEDPLKIIAKQLADKYRLICLDEFFVTDITDAMILARLLEELFKNNIILVTTSNIEPRDLYKDGLQRESFLPAIKLLQEFTDTISLGEGIDYRLHYLEQVKNYYLTSMENVNGTLLSHFNQMADVEPKHDREIIINDRKINFIAWSNDVIWFDFDELCRTARSAIDYLEIAQCFQTVFISNVHSMNDEQNDVARRFIHLIDALYDYKVKIFLSANRPLDQLYSGKNMAFAFARTISRLSEMCTANYMAKPHH